MKPVNPFDSFEHLFLRIDIIGRIIESGNYKIKRVNKGACYLCSGPAGNGVLVVKSDESESYCLDEKCSKLLPVYS